MHITTSMFKKQVGLTVVLLLVFFSGARGQQKDKMNINGILPQLGIMAEGTGVRSEVGVAAMIPWADKLWVVTYVSHGDYSGETGVGLYNIDKDMNMEMHPQSIAGTYANRMVHWQSNQAIIGPHFIDANGEVRTVKDLSKYRLAATMEHLNDVENKVYFLTMRGHVFEVNAHTLETKKVDKAPKGGHFKDAFTSDGKVFIAANAYDYSGEKENGILAEWDGKDWKYIENNPFNEINGIPDYGGQVFATGWDKRSAILRVYVDGEWQRYRFPKASLTFDDGSNTEWMRIRQVESERMLMDLFGNFYELPPFAFDNKIWGIRPVSSHLHVIPDFVSWRGMLVMGSDLVEHDEDEADGEPYVGQPTAGLWWLKIDDLWDWGKPKGWGAVWLEDSVAKGETSDPYIMTGFDKKVLHLANDGQQSVTFSIEVDFIGNGSWKKYDDIAIEPNGYKHVEFPDAFSAHWVRVKVDQACSKATAYFIYN